MNCPKCNCELPSGVLFCNECGFKTGNISLCTECGTSLKDGVLFCPVCRTPSRDKYNNEVKSEHEARNNSELSGYNSAFDSDESIERTMTIPVIKSNTHRPSESGEGASAERAGARPKANSREGITPKKSVNPNKRRVSAKRSGNGLSIVQKNVLIFVGFIAFLWDWVHNISRIVSPKENLYHEEIKTY